MPAYVIAQVDVQDPDTFAVYRDEVPNVVKRHGGRFVVRGGKVETLDGDWHPSRLVVIEFADLDQARRWHASPEYQELRAVRERSSRGSLVAVEGYVEPSA